jgi:hypothetical protein
MIKLSEALKLNSSVTSLSVRSNNSLLDSFSLNTANYARTEGAIKLSEALKLNTSLTSLNLSSNILLLHCMLTQYTGNSIGTEGGIKLSEALKSNSSLASLDLSGKQFVASFHSHSIQTIILVPKE